MPPLLVHHRLKRVVVATAFSSCFSKVNGFFLETQLNIKSGDLINIAFDRRSRRLVPEYAWITHSYCNEKMRNKLKVLDLISSFARKTPIKIYDSKIFYSILEMRKFSLQACEKASSFKRFVFIMVPIIINIGFGVSAEELVVSKLERRNNNILSADAVFEVKKAKIYYINLAFTFSNQREMELARKFAGDASRICQQLNDCGISTDVLLHINDQNGARIISGNFITGGHYYFNYRKYTRKITQIYLDPGLYSLRIKFNRQIDSLSALEFEISVESDPRSN